MNSFFFYKSTFFVLILFTRKHPDRAILLKGERGTRLWDNARSRLLDLEITAACGFIGYFLSVKFQSSDRFDSWWEKPRTSGQRALLQITSSWSPIATHLHIIGFFSTCEMSSNNSVVSFGSFFQLLKPRLTVSIWSTRMHWYIRELTNMSDTSVLLVFGSCLYNPQYIIYCIFFILFSKFIQKILQLGFNFHHLNLFSCFIPNLQIIKDYQLLQFQNIHL